MTNENTPAEIANESLLENTTNAEPIRDADAVLKKNRELLKENAELKRLAEQARNFDFERARQAMQELERAEEEKLTRRGEYEKLIEQKAKAYEERIENERRERTRIETTLKQEKLALALIEKGVLPDRVKWLVKELSEQVELSTTDSGFALKKLGGVGDATEFDLLVDEVRDKNPFFFAANITSGSGASVSSNSLASGSKKWAELTRAEKTAAIREANGDEQAARKKYN